MYRILLLAGGLFGAQAANAQRDTTITITSSGGLQYDQKRLIIKPNTRLKLRFWNKDDMEHNLVVTRPNSRLRVVEFALALGEKGPEQHHVPIMDDVLAHTVSVAPGNTDSLVVTLPEGAYPFVCTYPGHGSIMYGIIYATNDPRLPDPARDRNLPNTERVAEAAHANHTAASGHPYTVQLPAVYRTFMPDCGPAAIAVGLPGPDGGQSYVFDAGQCRLRYAWSGGFVDNTEQWDGKGQRLTKIVGDIYYRDTSDFPWRVGTAATPPQFKGYRLINRYPEFRYVVNGVEVRELIKPLPAGRGLVRTFTLSPTKQSVTFISAAQPGIQVKPSVGRLQNGEVRLPTGTKQFSITVSTM
ncbi:plastocyanin/azurin family copper-binding protein [Spirosoma arcticum]